ncbi:aryl-alcohol dehydrogenase-like predicted oxidoreductase [Litorivivens lipolytica]|uniref:Aryl-alcohol dehydrogenase-like predicted oxidoreductase n=1 Tax=Litorivivens lipolytica TaxID=1524264 RepID=A0A7W4Z6M4_9GAMM|nr:aldo/keto reductase [Litorivivens lipolytica]MBB3048362.1 aryl-alcohol dehydrogenase-like predicted oxidoreductase [Litorivivens lipolytica]
MESALSHRRFGSSDLMVSPLGLGTVKLGRDKGVKYPKDFTIPDDKAAADLIALARDLGINLIDTAPAYGRSEERLGKLLQGQRQDWVICSKVGEEFNNDSGDSHFDFSHRHTRQSIERSLDRLKTDYIDIVLIHSDGRDEHIIQHEGALEALQQCKQEGLIRAIGMSTKTVSGGLLAAELSDAVMVAYNPAHQEESPVLDYCARHGKAAILKKALGSGHLISEQDPAQAAMHFALSHPGVTSAIVGTINPEHLRENAEACQRALLQT